MAEEMVEAVAGYASLPVIVGGGIRRPEDAKKRVAAGASFIVTGSVLEAQKDTALVREFAQAIHGSA